MSTEHEDRDDFARAIALVDSLVDPPLSGRYGRYADAVMDRLHALGYRKQEPMSDEEVEAAAWAILKDDPAFNDTYGIEDYRNMARAALVAAQNVRNEQKEET